MKIETYRKAEEMQKLLNYLNDLELILYYHDASKITITNNTGVSKAFDSKPFFDMLKRFSSQERKSIEKEFNEL